MQRVEEQSGVTEHDVAQVIGDKGGDGGDGGGGEGDGGDGNGEGGGGGKGDGGDGGGGEGDGGDGGGVDGGGDGASMATVATEGVVDDSTVTPSMLDRELVSVFSVFAVEVPEPVRMTIETTTRTLPAVTLSVMSDGDTPRLLASAMMNAVWLKSEMVPPMVNSVVTTGSIAPPGVIGGGGEGGGVEGGGASSPW